MARQTRRPRAETSTAPLTDRIIDATLSLTAARGFVAIGLADIAEAAGATLAELRATYPGKLAILAAFSKRIDGVVLAGGPAEGEGARDRLFDIVMRRLDALAPYKPALRKLAAEARCRPGLATALHCIAGSSQKWMLAAAGIQPRGLMRAVALEGSVLVMAETLSVWIDDDEPDLGRTMKRLDQALDRGDRAMRALDSACGALCRVAGIFRRPAEESRAAG
jgi:AcrR family transcriptional regulator